jgi:4-aminobutyrate aminotransferase-like enzyme
MTTGDLTCDSLGTRDCRAIARGTRTTPIAIVGASGSTLTTADGAKLTDLTSGWNVANTGWAHPQIRAAVARQLDLPFAPSWCTHDPRVRYAERLGASLQGEFKAWCGCGGSEAIEAALKVARRATGRHAVVGFSEAYHGGTLGAMLAGGVPGLHGRDLPADPWHRHAPIPETRRCTGVDFGTLAADVILQDPLPAAVLLEPVFTNPGVLSGGEAFHQAVQSATRKAGALLIVDEIGTGFGRTGELFAYSHFGLDPDIIVVAKAMGSGVVPISGALIKSGIAEAVRGPGFDSTFGWTPLACSAALATLDVIESEALTERARELGAWCLKRTRDVIGGRRGISDVRGIGLEIGIELAEENGERLGGTSMSLLLEELRRLGVFAESSRYTSTLLIMPPLNIPESQLADAMNVVCDYLLRDRFGEAMRPVEARW